MSFDPYVMTPRLDPYVMTLMTKEIMMFRQTVASGDSQGHGIWHDERD
jgi:hypothetical protein